MSEVGEGISHLSRPIYSPAYNYLRTHTEERQRPDIDLSRTRAYNSP